MCGIAGILSYSGRNLEIRPSDLERMADAIIHRGPDSRGIWTSDAGDVGFAHTRLAIIDLSAAGAQPMHSQCKRYHIVFNGEIYNHLSIRRRLEHLGHWFIGRSDTETLLHALMQWGIDAVDRLEGMFAFCFFDEKLKRAWLVRDRIGVKPLYYSFRNGACLFASEIKALVSHPDISAEIDPLACYHYLTFLTTPAPQTMFKGIRKIPAGHYIEIQFAGENSPAAITGTQWWDAIGRNPDDGKYDDEEWVRGEVQRLLGESIEKRMMSDVPFGVFLSGGIDSSTNVALMARLTDQPVRTFTVGFKDRPDYNELDYARKIHELFKTEHHEILITEDDTLDYLERLVVTQDEPLADWVCVPLYFVSKLARESGTIVVQIGEGSDELFCGYDEYMRTFKWLRKYWRPLVSMPKSVRAMVYGLTFLLERMDDRWRGRKERVYRAWKDRELFWGGAICYPEGFKNEIVRDRESWRRRALADDVLDDPVGWLPEGFRALDSFGVVSEYLAKFDAEERSPDYLKRMIYLELKLRLVELLLMRVDKVTMSNSIEARVPFLDHKLVEFSMNIPQSLKISNDVPKYILKESVRGLIPDENIDRPKMGFDAPVREWLKGPLGDKVEATFRTTKLRNEGLIDFDKGIDLLNDHRHKERDYSFNIWSLFNLALWYDAWIDGPVSSRTQEAPK